MLVLTAFYGVIVQQYYLYIKALLYVMFKGFNGVVCYVWYSGAVNNNKVSGCSDGCVTGSGSHKVGVVVWDFSQVRG